MDIDLFWSTGGIFRFFLQPNICMATNPKLGSSPPSDQISAKTLNLFLFFSLLFVLSAFANSSGEFSKPSVYSDMAAAVTRKKPFSAETEDFNPAGKKADHHHHHHAKSKERDRHQFGASEHEVPSGPNPTSNK